MAFEPEALQVVARRAGGSLRDAQSLLDRLLASGSAGLTVEVVHTLLGTASDERLLAIARGPGRSRLGRGASPPRAERRRRRPALRAAGRPARLAPRRHGPGGRRRVDAAGDHPEKSPPIERLVDRWPVDSILAALQILAACRSRMRGSFHGRLLLEMALVRVARLEELATLSTLVEQLAALESGAHPATRGSRRQAEAQRTRQPRRRRHTCDPRQTKPRQPPPARRKPSPLQRGGPLQSTPPRVAARQPRQPPPARPQASPYQGGAGGVVHFSRHPARAKPKTKPRQPPPARPQALPLTKGGPGGSPTSVDSATPAIHAGAEPAEAKPDRPAAEPPVADLAPSVSGSTRPPWRQSAWERPASQQSYWHVKRRARPGTSSWKRPNPRRDRGRSHRRATRNPSPASAHRGEPAASISTPSEVWPDLIKKVGTTLGWKLAQVEPIEVEQPDLLVIAVKPGYNATSTNVGHPRPRPRSLRRCSVWFAGRSMSSTSAATAITTGRKTRGRTRHSEPMPWRGPLGPEGDRALRGASGPGGLRRRRPVFRKLTEPAGNRGPADGRTGFLLA